MSQGTHHLYPSSTSQCFEGYFGETAVYLKLKPHICCYLLLFGRRSSLRYTSEHRSSISLFGFVYKINSNCGRRTRGESLVILLAANSILLEFHGAENVENMSLNDVAAAEQKSYTVALLVSKYEFFHQSNPEYSWLRRLRQLQISG